MLKTNHTPHIDAQKKAEPIRYTTGFPYPFGAKLLSDGGINFSVHCGGDAKCSLVLYHIGDSEPFYELPLTEDYATGEVYAVTVYGIDPAITEYGYRFRNASSPTKEDSVVLADPYATAISGRNHWGFADYLDSEYTIRSQFSHSTFDWENDQPLHHDFSDLILYEMHVRGFTKGADSHVSHPGTYEAVIEKLPYLKELGINCVELMPILEFDELDVIQSESDEKLYQYWGYQTLNYFSPKTGYAAFDEPVATSSEFKAMVKKLHRNGIEIILDINFAPIASAEYADLFMLDCLRYWVCEYHVDGFRVNQVPAISSDPILAKTKFICDTFPYGKVSHAASWNRGFRDCIRRYIKSDIHASTELFSRMSGSLDLGFGVKHGLSVNYVSCHEGFTLNDLVSYNYKHNFANGEFNKDGEDANLSWNCGIEGPTDDENINKLRKQAVKNAAVFLFLSRGIPMLLSGDEFMNSQNGNNNAYCQDNETSWLSWSDLTKNKDIFTFFQKMIKLRKAYPVIRCFDNTKTPGDTAYPALSFHGTLPWHSDTSKPSLTCGLFYSQSAQKFQLEEDGYLYLAINMHWEEQTLYLPSLPLDGAWTVYADTSERNTEGTEINTKEITLTGRSIAVLIGKKGSL